MALVYTLKMIAFKGVLVSSLNTRGERRIDDYSRDWKVKLGVGEVSKYLYRLVKSRSCRGRANDRLRNHIKPNRNSASESGSECFLP